MTQESSLGVIDRSSSGRRIDYLYRISMKSLVRNSRGEVLVVKEVGRDWWDLPGGGMDHGEDIRTSIAREMKEEVDLEGSFSYRILHVDEPAFLQAHDFWQVRLIFEVKPEKMIFSPGDDADEVAFKNPSQFKDSPIKAERLIYEYANIGL